jgi:hypothetical protein
LRARNVFYVIGVAFAAFGANIFLKALLFGSWTSHSVAGGKVASVSVTSLFLAQLVSLGVLTTSGAVLFRLVDSEVPLKWCLGLGCLYAGSYFLFAIIAFSKTPNLVVPSIVSLIPLILIGVGMLVTPVIGGYQAKRISRRKFKGPPN